MVANTQINERDARWHEAFAQRMRKLLLRPSCRGHRNRERRRQVWRGPLKGQYSELSIRFTNVFVKRDARWQIVLHQGTQIPPK
jgi:hypothetical protein